jgi:hypothetical protein
MRRVYWSITTSTQKVRKAHRLTSEQINAMKTIFRMTDESEPGRSFAVRRRIRCFISTTARIKSWSGPIGPGFARYFGENSNRYWQARRGSARFKNFVDTPWKIVFRFIERLLQSRKSFKSFQAFSERLGISKDCVDLPNGELTLPILETVVRRPTPFVVLVREGIVQRIADRAALATRMAVGA